MLYKCVQSIVRKHQTNTEKINSYKSDLVDLFRSLGLAPFVNTPCQRSDEEHSRVFQISLDEVYDGLMSFSNFIYIMVIFTKKKSMYKLLNGCRRTAHEKVKR